MRGIELTYKFRSSVLPGLSGYFLNWPRDSVPGGKCQLLSHCTFLWGAEILRVKGLLEESLESRAVSKGLWITRLQVLGLGHLCIDDLLLRTPLQERVLVGKSGLLVSNVLALLNIKTYLDKVKLDLLDVLTFCESHSDLPLPCANVSNCIMVNCCLDYVLCWSYPSQVSRAWIVWKSLDDKVYHVVLILSLVVLCFLTEEVTRQILHLQTLCRGAVDVLLLIHSGSSGRCILHVFWLIAVSI